MENVDLQNNDQLNADEAKNTEIPTDLSSLSNFDWSEFFLYLAMKALNAAISLAIALVLLIIGLIIIKIIMFIVRKALSARKNMDPTLQRWLISVIGTALKVFLIIIFIDSLGIETLSIAGMIAAVGVAIGSALSGIVQNFAAGIIIIALKPIKVGEWIRVSGVDGTVVEIRVCNTYLVTFDNKVHIVPNVVLVNNPITNYSRQPVRRVDVILAVPIDQKLEEVGKCILDALYSCTTDNKVLDNPHAKVAVSSIDGIFTYLIITPFINNTNPDNFVRCLWHFKEIIVRALKKKGIPVAVPNLHIYLHEGEPKASMAPPDPEEQIEELQHRLHSRSRSHGSKQGAALLTIDDAEPVEEKPADDNVAAADDKKEPVEEHHDDDDDDDDGKLGKDDKKSSKSRRHKHKEKKN